MISTTYNLIPSAVAIILSLDSIKDARKLFRLFKSIIEYQALVDILLDENDNLLKIFRVLRQIFFFFYWFFDNISIAYKVKLFRGNFKKFNVIASTFWLFSVLLAIPVLYIEYKTNRHSKNAKNNLLDSIKYCFDILPALRDSNLLEKSLKVQVRKEIAAIGGMISASITTYELIT